MHTYIYIYTCIFRHHYYYHYHYCVCACVWCPQWLGNPADWAVGQKLRPTQRQHSTFILKGRSKMQISFQRAP